MKSVHVITISREYGSGGTSIGQELALRLGWKLLDRELIRELARRSQVEPSVVVEMDEHTSSFIGRLLKTFWLGNLSAWSGALPEPVDEDYFAQLSGVVIREAAKLGKCVIVGRGAQCVLQEQQNALHVFVYGSKQEKFRRIRSHYQTDGDCESAMGEFDRTRSEYIRRYYGCDWANCHLYDLMIDSDAGIGRTADVILAAAALAPQQETLTSGRSPSGDQ